MRRFLALLCLALTACPEVKRPETKDFVATGSVYAGGVEKRGEPIAAARVRAWPEGSPGAGTAVESDDAGFWRLSLPSTDARVLLEVAADGWVPATRALTAAPSTQVSFGVALEPLEQLDCSSDSCTVASDGLRIDSAPEGAFGAARAIDPSTGTATVVGLETLRVLAVTYIALDAGDFDPDAGGFASDGGTVTSQLALRLPYDAWKRLDDVTSGTGRIEVPLRQLDLATGQWVPRGEAVLTSEAGLELPESALAALRSGQLRTGAIAVGALPSSGYWAVAWPAASPGCIEGTALVEGAGAEGVVLEAAPREAATSGVKGAFCAPASVAAGGESAEVQLTYAGVSYTPVSLPLPDAPGRCGAGSCRAVGAVKIEASATVATAACKVTGTVKDPAGALLPGAVVVGLDDSVPRSLFTTLCGKLGTRCPLAVAADESAHFELVMPVQRSVQLSGRALVENPGGLDGVREGGMRVAGCPSAPVDLVLRAGRDALQVEVQPSGNQVSWTPASAATQLVATDADGGVKWELSSAVGMLPPVNTPSPLVSGDVVDVRLIGTDARGYQFSGGASAAVP